MQAHILQQYTCREILWPKRLAAFDKVLEQKAKRVFALQNIDQFEVSEAEAERIRKQLSFLEPELQTMFDLRTVAEDIEEASFEATAYWYDWYRALLKEHERLKTEFEQLRYDHHHLFLDYVTAEGCLQQSRNGEKLFIEIILNQMAQNAVTSNPR